ncbi:prepilin-type N-terminal cleavage/methylation domain-containing protein [Candidatus Parcubacteria bacterium]|nr:prepilin-type N-terminal cleavage/methylation domain-containing protein [Candidatus Parcubacteria bacterium]
MQNSRGFNLVEVLVAATIITVFLAALVGTSNLYLRASRTSPERAKALYLAEEGIENLVYMRDQSWTAYIASAPTDSTENIGAFTRRTELAGASNHTKSARVSVSWLDHDSMATVSLTALISNLYDN